jgi:hypothetical protein
MKKIKQKQWYIFEGNKPYLNIFHELKGEKKNSNKCCLY